VIELHREIAACQRCVVAGYLPVAAPVLSGYADNRIMLIGQAPGAVEAIRRLPFQGRSGKVLISWLMRVGFKSEAHARRNIYMTSITKCFPGKGSGGGDRRPSRAEVELCRPHLDRQLQLINPALLILVGGLSHERFLPGRPLDASPSIRSQPMVEQPGEPRPARTRASPPAPARPPLA
jgi:uracil-DNA glycosylase